jgi:hypothetical protein
VVLRVSASRIENRFIVLAAGFVWVFMRFVPYLENTADPIAQCLLALELAPSFISLH